MTPYMPIAASIYATAAIPDGSLRDAESTLTQLALVRGCALAAFFFHDSPVKQVHRSIRMPCKAWIVRHHADSCAIVVQFAE